MANNNKSIIKPSPKGVVVIGAGLGRTGTSSLKLALEQLGIGKCYSLSETLKNGGDNVFFYKAWVGYQVDWHLFLEGRGYHAVVGYPACQYFEELMKFYPDANVILTVRDPVRWHESIMQTIYLALPKGWDQFFHRNFSPEGIATIFDLPGVLDLENFNRSGRDLSERENAINQFNKWNEHVKKVVPKDRLLVLDVREGWRPLCAFLNVPIPDHPFPHVNDAVTSRKVIWRIRTMQRVLAAGSVVGAVALVWAVAQYGRSAVGLMKALWK
ncbi:hypothetical protein SeLEV6574_g04191 [Synchytrium endobioticum]|uniref:Sulfotransferase domain-containing protein n=1 Tax=Synchytrium endobioticum TaxID=286115 RepID=A0A507D0D4_9FUNG|nr:hypothetical protein SeLEV6574_g04191 [Synchytrium endobioticum]